MITTTAGDMEEALLRKTTGCVDNDNEETTWVEYCFPACCGEAHVTGKPDAPGLFCSQHIHRSVAVRLKKGLKMFGTAQDLGKVAANG